MTMPTFAISLQTAFFLDHTFYSLTIQDVVQETHDTVTLVFEPSASFPKDYKAGQFLTIRSIMNGQDVRRAYSLASSPSADKNMAISIKRVKDGEMSNWLADYARAGMSLEVMPPLGNFVFQPHPTQRRWFMLYAAGSGITPIFSILKTILTLEPQSFVSLLYGNRHENDIIYRDQLAQWVLRYPSRLKVLHTLTQPSESWFGQTGRITVELIHDTLESLKPITPFEETHVYMCGPAGMMDEVTEVAANQGVKKSNIHRESFTSSLDEASKEAAIEEFKITNRSVTIHLDGDVFEVQVLPKTTILEAALEVGVDMPYSCQSGLCTACRGKCVSGKVHMDEREGLLDEEIEEGYILTCVGHPLTDDVVIEMG